MCLFLVLVLFCFMNSHFWLLALIIGHMESYRKSLPLHHVGHWLCFQCFNVWVLHWGLWCFWHFFLCQVIDMSLFSFFCTWTSSTICWICFSLQAKPFWYLHQMLSDQSYIVSCRPSIALEEFLILSYVRMEMAAGFHIPFDSNTFGHLFTLR